MLLNLIFWLSCSSLAVEVLLARIFAVSQWHHLAFMVISLVMFGFAAGGTYWSLHTLRGVPGGLAERARSLAGLLAGLYALSTICGLLAVLHIPLDYFRLPVESIQLLYLLGLYFLLALPFFVTGLMLALTFAAVPERTGRIYFATMTGSALGAALPYLLLRLIGEPGCIILMALLPLGVHDLGPWAGCPAPLWRRAGTLLLIGLGGYGALFPPAWMILNPNPYKALSQVRQFPDTRVSLAAVGLRGRLQHVQSPYLRFAPGLSLKYSGELPVPEAIFRDGDAPVYLYPDGGAHLEFARHTLSYGGYVHHPNPQRALLIIQNGGLAAACALAGQAREITVLSDDVRVAAWVADHYNLAAPRLRPRRFLHRSPDRYDLIQLENWGYSLPGTAALEPDYLLTREAFRAMLDRLDHGGLMVLSRRLLLPPSDDLRIWATAYQALKARGAAEPADHLALYRNWDTLTLIIGREPLSNLGSLSRWMDRLNFDPVHLPGGIPARRVNRFNQFPSPYLYEGIQALTASLGSGSYPRFLASQDLDLGPASDRRPYPNRFLKWSRLSHLYQTTGERFYTLWMSGELVVVVVLGLAGGLALIFLALPMPRAHGAQEAVTLGFGAYFLSVGAGFIWIEMYLIHLYTLLAGQAVVSMALTLGGMLFFAGLGGLRVQRKGFAHCRRDLAILLAGLALWLAATPRVVALLLGLGETLSLTLAAAWLAPAAFALGMPFPAGMAALGGTPRGRCLGWSMNGIASVVGAVAAVPMALTFGDPILGWAGWACYGAALVALSRRSPCPAT